MNFIERLIPHLIFGGALLPTLLVLAAAAVSFAGPYPGPEIAVALPLQPAADCGLMNFSRREAILGR